MILMILQTFFATQLHAAPHPALRMSWGYHKKSTISLQQEKIAGHLMWTMSYWGEGASTPRLLGKRVLTDQYAADFNARIKSLTPFFPTTMDVSCRNSWTLETGGPRTRKFVCLDSTGKPFNDRFSALVKSARFLLHLD